VAGLERAQARGFAVAIAAGGLDGLHGSLLVARRYLQPDAGGADADHQAGHGHSRATQGAPGVSGPARRRE
jgi:hypothetical protein